MARKHLADPASRASSPPGARRRAALRVHYTCFAQPFFDRPRALSVNPVTANEIELRGSRAHARQVSRRVWWWAAGRRGSRRRASRRAAVPRDAVRAQRRARRRAAPGGARIRAELAPARRLIEQACGAGVEVRTGTGSRRSSPRARSGRRARRERRAARACRVRARPAARLRRRPPGPLFAARSRRWARAWRSSVVARGHQHRSAARRAGPRGDGARSGPEAGRRHGAPAALARAPRHARARCDAAREGARAGNHRQRRARERRGRAARARRGSRVWTLGWRADAARPRPARGGTAAGRADR